VTPEAVAEAGIWLDQYAAASEALQTNAASALATTWGLFDGWYSAGAVAELAAEAAGLSLAGQDAMAGLAGQYIDQLLAALGHTAPETATPLDLPPVRNGADLVRVYRRPAEVFRQAVATGSDPGSAAAAAADRAGNLIRSDLVLTERAAQQAQMTRAGVQTYRRVIRPELSESGTCGLCIAASDRIYRTGELMPIHPPNCKCKTMPIVDGQDPGRSLNEFDLKRLYRDAGSTKAEELRRTRYRVNEHGELGPMLTRRGDDFRGPADVKPLEQDPERAARMLEKVLPVLESLESRAAAGEDVEGPLSYQRSLVERLQRIAA
jgi:hypothetical protein